MQCKARRDRKNPSLRRSRRDEWAKKESVAIFDDGGLHRSFPVRLRPALLCLLYLHVGAFRVVIKEKTSAGTERSA